MNTNNHFDAIIIGGGPAGMTAGIYLSRARLNTLIISDGVPGGQMILTHEIANYPGVESISGYQLSNIMKKQAKSFGCTIKGNSQVTDLQLEGEIKSVTLSDGTTYTSNVIILTPGGRSRTLNVPGEAVFKGQGISYCATCDGDFFTGKEIVVVGGGNSALEEAVSLTKYATKVTIVHQFDHFQAFEYAVEEAKANPKIHFIMESTITGFHGNEKLEHVDIKNLKTGEVQNFLTDGVFIFIGYVPNTEFLRGKVEMNQWNEIVVNSDMATSIPGVYAAGDSIVKRYRQVTTAVGDGTIAALAASGYIHQLKSRHLHETLAH
ncbi:FAD-dependent oxidoreductase [Lentimicrobium sp.]|jgi:thioredoxin reductase (NADPH)|uniref:NAD(P)/FAD-dependent oxidoreductase n=1 Tax=Lentimicrobium sp. TaxID=2034841 RepID=UPI0025E670B9|nr:FAD-dependent oxidoreductase [Lentimicrobium sp.]MCO5257873.1 FAD-dependent oxidoreductase [Lentimicrobium sp.]MCO5263222.1 FAD-dependent oxidoreductase [Lentimicrobium sp.]HOP12855.1 FAD-dependent oxidoreductase [Lentimicrobium sp.]HPJ62848.1 FAD-dependent oxidoreductase [Lentimicrobium sp.]HPR25425.1 FAD-dependent oxidoreductase [Lentimicrobium sp.]